MKLFLIASLLFVPVLLLAEARVAQSRAKLAPEMMQSLPELITQLEAKKDKDTLVLARFAQNVLGMTQFPAGYSAPGGYQESHLARGMAMQIRVKPQWNETIKAVAREVLTKNRALFEKAFSEDKFSLAWLRLHLGEKSEAKKILRELYAAEFDHVMKLEQAVSGMGRTPLGEAEQLFAALQALGEKSEQAELEAKMRKMKAHVSSLPEAHIVT